MRRRLLTVVAAVSLLLAIAIAMFWGHSYLATGMLDHFVEVRDGTWATSRRVAARSSRGAFGEN